MCVSGCFWRGTSKCEVDCDCVTVKSEGDSFSCPEQPAAYPLI